jgi:beta-glucosidase-like glycosyl hydrolase
MVLPFGHGCATPAQLALAPAGFCNTSLPVAARAAALVRAMTQPEKVNLTWISGCTDADPTDGGVPRLGIPGYTWGVEILHGAQARCRLGACPTIFPVLASQAASFNASAWHAVGDAISTEVRAANNLHIGRTDCALSVLGANGWGPNVNLVRDPRWGRNIEVGSECPYVSGRLGAALIQGIQGSALGTPVDVGAAADTSNASNHVKLLASIKHFSVYSMEGSGGASRQGFDPNVTLRDMAESYLPAFRAAIRDGGALGMMCSYTSVNGTAFCESGQWLRRWAREKHGFAGNVVTDCGALNMPGPEAAVGDNAHNAAKALNAGADLNCGQPWAYKDLGAAINQSLVAEAKLDETVARSMQLRLRTGMFDPVEEQPYTRLGLGDFGAAAHHELAYDAATRGLVLLQNPPAAPARTAGDGGATKVLPLSAAKSTAVIGPHGKSTRALLGSYFDAVCPPPPVRAGVSAQPAGGFDCVTTPLQAIGALTDAPPSYSAGCPSMQCDDPITSKLSIAAAVRAAKAADQVVLLVGLSQKIEGEGRDRADNSLPGAQLDLVRAVVGASEGKPIAVVMLNGGIVSIDELVGAEGVAVVEAWYPGIEGGRALADALFGKVNRWGKLPVTIYSSTFSEQVDMLEMSFTAGLGRTYKFWRGDAALWEFGAGLSYTDFELAWEGGRQEPPAAVVVTSLNDTVTLEFGLANTGAELPGEEVVFVFHQPLSVPGAPAPLPIKQLVAFRRVALAQGASASLSVAVPSAELGLVDDAGSTMLFPGEHALVLSRGHGPTLTLHVTVQCGQPLVIETLF